MKIFISAAGSGGHIYPALSFAQAFKELDNVIITFITSSKSIDKEIFKTTKYKVILSYMGSSPFQKRSNLLILSLKISQFLVKFIIEWIRMFSLLIYSRPDAAIGFGGISSVPLICSARLLQIPTIIHEQNVQPGLANRYLASIVTKVALGFEQSNTYLKKKNWVVTGNPVRDDLKKIEKSIARESLGLRKQAIVLLLFGGSQGADFINTEVIEALALLDEKFRQLIEVIHITGKSDNGSIEQTYKNAGIRANIKSYVLNMSQVYSAADMVICRAGAGTITELNYFQKAAVLIPYPFARAHQLANAYIMSQLGCSIVLKQTAGSKAQLVNILSDLLEHPSHLKKLSQAANALNGSFAADKLVKVVTDEIKIKD